MRAPAARSRATEVASSDARCPRRNLLPQSVGRPAISKLSFTVTGTPCSSPGGSPRLTFEQHDECIYLRIVARDLAEVGLDQLDRRDPALAHHGGHETQRGAIGHPLKLACRCKIQHPVE